MLKVEHLTKYYQKKLAVDDISFEIKEGSVFGIIGPNGAGKTTTTKCILNFINKNSGKVYFEGQELTKKSDSLKEYIGYVPSEVNLYEELTVMEMIKLSDSFYKKDCIPKAKKLIKELSIEANKKIEELSFGNLKKVSIVLALMHDPKLVILDEATSGLDPLIREKFFDIIKEEQKKGTTFFYSTHILNEITRICDEVAIIKDGKIVALEEVSKITKVDSSIITIVSPEFKKLKLPMKDIIIKEESKNHIKFIYKGNINDLIKLLTTIKIDDILIEEPTIDEIFLHYYK